MSTLTKKESQAFLKRLKNLKKDLAIVETTAFAAFTGINRQTLNDWFSGRSTPRCEIVYKFEVGLQVKLEEMDFQADMIRSYLAARVPATDRMMFIK